MRIDRHTCGPTKSDLPDDALPTATIGADEELADERPLLARRWIPLVTFWIFCKLYSEQMNSHDFLSLFAAKEKTPTDWSCWWMLAKSPRFGPRISLSTKSCHDWLAISPINARAALISGTSAVLKRSIMQRIYFSIKPIIACRNR